MPTLSRLIFVTAALMLAGCEGGARQPDTGSGAGTDECSGQCADSTSFLSVADVQTIFAQAIVEAEAQNAEATIAVVDRVGNVLGVFRMNGADQTIRVDGGRDITTGLDGIRYIPDTLAAISKAITGAYLSSEGNAFSTRTASQIVQQNFNPGEADQPGGPLFGVQFSNLPCSDLNTRSVVTVGPQRSPLGLSADPGGFPLYKDGTVVGGIGAISSTNGADGVYSLDADASDMDRDIDELIALAGSFGYAAPADRRGDRITADGKTFRFSDVNFDDLGATPGDAPSFISLLGSGTLPLVPGYGIGGIFTGTAFGQPASGIRADNSTFAGLDAFILVDGLNANRYPPSAGTDGADALTATEVETLLEQALTVANRARAQIRRPLGSQARVTISIVDTNGAILGIVRTRDAPVFGIDVSLQKARSAAFFSNSNAATDLAAAPAADYLDRAIPTDPLIDSIVIGDYVTDALDFDPELTLDGEYAFSARALGNLTRPYFPDGQIGAPPGPFSKTFKTEWSPFSTGLQLDLSINRIINHVAFVLGLAGVDAPQNCTAIPRLANGIQIFPGGMPIYRGNTLVGAIGVSGDGVDQDDMIAFLGLHNAGQELNGEIGNAPANIRADNLTPQGIRLRYVQCPQAPFIDNNEQNVCDGK